MQIAQSLGVALSASWVQNFATQDLYQGLDDTSLSAAIGAKYLSGQAGPNGGGKSTQLTQQIKAMGEDYGINLSGGWVSTMVRRALVSGTGIEASQQALEKLAISAYPTLAKQIEAGQTVKDIAQPFLQAMAATLEIDPNTIRVNDPTIQKALNGQMPASNTPTGTPAQGGSGAKPAAVPAGPNTLYDFQNALRADPRWDKTDNAKASAYTMLHQLGQTFGFAS
jgi:hypothetical protein